MFNKIKINSSQHPPPSDYLPLDSLPESLKPDTSSSCQTQSDQRSLPVLHTCVGTLEGIPRDTTGLFLGVWVRLPVGSFLSATLIMHKSDCSESSVVEKEKALKPIKLLFWTSRTTNRCEDNFFFWLMLL